jgi:uroporphyrinogen-III synthase
MFVTSAAVAETAADMLASAEPHDVAALRPATAAALASRHVPVSITAERGAHPLALEVSHALSTRGIRSASIWYPTSDLAEERDEHHEALGVLRALGSVTRVVAYETRAPKALASDMERLPSAYGVVFASPSAVEHFVRAAADSPVPQRVVCWGASTLKAALPFFSGAVEASRERHLFETLKTQEAHHG